jgi:hypothetical protein
VTATPAQTQALFQVLRNGINATGYGDWVSDATLMPIAATGANAVVAAAPKPTPAPAPQPTPVAASKPEGST